MLYQVFSIILLSSSSILLTSLADDSTTDDLMTTDHYDDSTTEDSTTDDTSEEPPMTTLPPPNSCDMTMRAYIHQFCQGYFSLPDCQGTTTEAPPMPIPIYEDACTIPSKLVDPLFNNDTTTMALTVLEVNLKSTIYIFKNHLKQFFFIKLYANTKQQTADGESFLDALQVDHLIYLSKYKFLKM